MNRQEKEALVDSLRKNFDQAEAAFLVGCSGLSVNVMQDLRSKLRGKGARLKVAKMRLVKRALSDNAAYEGFMPYLHEERGVIFAQQEPTAVAKVLHDFVKDNENFDIVLGYVEKEYLDADTVKYLATLPSREILLAQVVGTMQMPITQFVGVLNMMLVRLLVVLKQIAEKKEKEA
ncbi:TPA: 50S ribosomal protein L10 [Candidatus Dependentiae bacterium]|nr:MAG: 50S ribosomal protein L10 [candidate division TM6 bacterium GW2011_GWF2_36_131]KKQ02868.1 MAG: 50S ribosomal protein L10 [candidate division TM6 bacterium GW2011_GWE2_36_25]KKQ19521.1 MAG: 50S ribosomal protein L10 [candidate division TM6 bacterium GW2011_GWA2_36_9]HBR70234.1 50S ribosomal protein L10 [Candidatus Dependentiae bacterium]HCU00618.1 50S ribosomal protein L10 [Candidatus Dependentiae bacterium]